VWRYFMTNLRLAHVTSSVTRSGKTHVVTSG
jgi:hypothetical protein